MKTFNLYVFLLLLALNGCLDPMQRVKADLIVNNAEIWTGNPNQPSATAMAVKNAKIMAIGPTDVIEKLNGPNTVVIDAGGAFITPGFIDSHVHFVTGGFRLSSVQLRDAATPQEFISRIADFANDLEPGAWITGGDWDHENWGGELPSRWWIDSVSTKNPVWIHRLDGHMALANSLALSAAGISEGVQNIAGGEFVRDRRGRLTGVLKDNAMYPVNRAVPPPSTEQEDRAMRAAMAYVASNGVTSVHNMSGYMHIFDRFRERDELITRIYAGMYLSDWIKLHDRIQSSGNGDEWLRVGGLKGFMDGSLGSHTAAFLEPYDDTPDDAGFLVVHPDSIHALIKMADAAGLQMTIHAIGDLANRKLMDIFESVADENGPRDRRFRIEHAQHIHPDDIPRFAKLGVIASMQPYHAIDDGRWAERYIGNRIKTTYAFRSLLDANAKLAFGSDWFVAPPTPLEGIYAAVTRRTLDDANPDGWVPEQKISVEEALTAYTRTAAYASFEERIKGVLAPGMLADFVLLERNLLTIPPGQIRDVNVIRTVVGGKTVYLKNDD